MEWHATGIPEGDAVRIQFHPRTKAEFKAYVLENGPIRLTVTHDRPESAKMRRWYEGGLVRLITHYQEGLDHHDPEHRRKVREWLKAEFNAEIIEVAGKAQRVAKSTAGRAVFEPFVERVQDWFVENYAPPLEAMDPERWKAWNDTVRTIPGSVDNYLDYLIEIGILPAHPKRS